MFEGVFAPHKCAKSFAELFQKRPPPHSRARRRIGVSFLSFLCAFLVKESGVMARTLQNCYIRCNFLICL